MTPEAEKLIDSVQKANHGNIDANGDFILDESIRGLAERKGTSMPQTRRQTQSKIPKAILESLQKNPIDTNVLSDGIGGASILDELNIPKANPTVPAPSPRPMQQINEAAYPQQIAYPQQTVYQQPVPYVSSGVDYGIIKQIVEQCLKENIESIKNTLIKESSLKMIRMGEGNKIQLVDNKGNLFESTLSFKKNISKK